MKPDITLLSPKEAIDLIKKFSYVDISKMYQVPLKEAETIIRDKIKLLNTDTIENANKYRNMQEEKKREFEENLETFDDVPIYITKNAWMQSPEKAYYEKYKFSLS